jgi:hypothetical protein
MGQPDGYTRRWARAVRDGAFRRLGTSLGIATLLIVPILAAVAVYVNTNATTPEQGVVNSEALRAAILGGVEAVVVWGLIVLTWSAFKAPAEIDASSVRALSEGRDREADRAKNAEARLRDILDDLLGILTLEGVDVRVGHLPDTDVCSVSVGIVLRNSSQVPVRYAVRELHVIVEHRAAADPLPNLTGYVPPFGGASTHYSPYVMDIPWHFPMSGEVQFAVAYGVRSRAPTYIFRGAIALTLAEAGTTPESGPGVLAQLWNWVGEPKFERLPDGP